jgi:hypothetical protein
MCSLAESSSVSVSAIIRGGSRDVSAAIANALAPFGRSALAFAATRNIRIVPLTRRQRYCDASASLRRLGVDVDAWPVPPAGLFVVEERCVYLRSATPMTVAHEFAHGLDCALGGGVYRSGYDRTVRRAFARARDFVTPYAATGLDEYFAESVRAYVEVNDARSPWPKATRARLRAVDESMFDFVERLFELEFTDPDPAEAPSTSSG